MPGYSPLFCSNCQGCYLHKEDLHDAIGFDGVIMLQNLKENDQRTKGLDSLLNAETVKYFSMEDWETQRYRNAIELYQVKPPTG